MAGAVACGIVVDTANLGSLLILIVSSYKSALLISKVFIEKNTLKKTQCLRGYRTTIAAIV